MIYLYQYNPLTEHSLISPVLHDGYEERGRVEARDWLHAKAALGFDLTPLQKKMLPATAAERQWIQRLDAEYGR